MNKATSQKTLESLTATNNIPEEKITTKLHLFEVIAQDPS